MKGLVVGKRKINDCGGSVSITILQPNQSTVRRDGGMVVPGGLKVR